MPTGIFVGGNKWQGSSRPETIGRGGIFGEEDEQLRMVRPPEREERPVTRVSQEEMQRRVMDNEGDPTQPLTMLRPQEAFIPQQERPAQQSVSADARQQAEAEAQTRQADLDRFLKEQHDKRVKAWAELGFRHETTEERQRIAALPVQAATNRNRFLSSLPQAAQNRALTSPESEEGLALAAVEKAGIIKAGGDAALTMADLEAIESIDPGADVNRQPTQYGKMVAGAQREIRSAVRGGQRAAANILAEIRASEDFNRLTTEEFTQRYERGIAEIPESQRMPALMWMVENKPQEIREKERMEIEAEAKIAEAEGVESARLKAREAYAISSNAPFIQMRMLEELMDAEDIESMMTAMRERTMTPEQHTLYNQLMAKHKDVGGAAFTTGTDGATGVSRGTRKPEAALLTVEGRTIPADAVRGVDEATRGILSAEAVTFEPPTAEVGREREIPAVQVDSAQRIVDGTRAKITAGKDYETALNETAQEVFGDDYALRMGTKFGADVQTLMRQQAGAKVKELTEGQQVTANAILDDTILKNRGMDAANMDPELNALGAMLGQSGGDVTLFLENNPDAIRTEALEWMTRNYPHASLASPDKYEAALKLVQTSMERNLVAKVQAEAKEAREAAEADMEKAAKERANADDGLDTVWYFNESGDERMMTFRQGDPQDQAEKERFTRASSREKTAMADRMQQQHQFRMQSESITRELLDDLSEGRIRERTLFRAGETVYQDRPMLGKHLDLNELRTNLDRLDALTAFEEALTGPDVSLLSEDRQAVIKAVQDYKENLYVEYAQDVEEDRQAERQRRRDRVDRPPQSLEEEVKQQRQDARNASVGGDRGQRFLKSLPPDRLHNLNMWLARELDDKDAPSVVKNMAEAGVLDNRTRLRMLEQITSRPEGMRHPLYRVLKEHGTLSGMDNTL